MTPCTFLSNLKPILLYISLQDCFSISVLHLLAQTEFASDLKVLENHEECSVGTCLLSNFMSRYVGGKWNRLDANRIFANYVAFGLQGYS